MLEWFRFKRFQSRLKKSMETYNKLDDPWSAERQAEQIGTILQELIPPVDTLFEVGCGQGTITEKLLPLAKEVTAMDVSSEAIQKVKAKISDEKVTFKQADIHSYHFNKPVDTILLSFIISYLGYAKHRRRFVQLLHKLCANSNQIVLIQPMNGPEDMHMIQAIQVIFQQFGLSCEKDFTREESSPALYCASFRKGNPNEKK